MANGVHKRLAIAMSLTVAVLLLSIPAVAHHGTNISYDHEHPITFKATVTEFVFRNPHAQIYFDVKDEKGNVEHWNGELTNPSNLMHAGWTKRRSEQELPPGTRLGRQTTSPDTLAPPRSVLERLGSHECITRINRTGLRPGGIPAPGGLGGGRREGSARWKTSG